MKFKFIVLLLLFLAAFSQLAGAQQNPKPLSKDQIMGLARAGMETSDLVKLIHEHGIDFDPGNDYLQALRQAGAQEPVLQALRATRPKRLSRQQVLELLTSHVPNERTAELVTEHGIDFSPDDQYLEMLRLAGADDTVIAALRAASSAAPAPPQMVAPVSRGGGSASPLGVEVRNLDEISVQTYKVPDGGGVLVADVTAGSAGDIAGITPGDVIRKLNGQEIQNADQFSAQWAALGPGIAALEVWRDGALANVQVTLGVARYGYAGLQIRSLNEDLAKQYKAPDLVGALVMDVTSGGPADRAGVKQGDVIRKCYGQATESSDRLTTTVASLSPGTAAPLEILRGGQPLTLTMIIGERPGGLRARSDERVLEHGTLRGISVSGLSPELHAAWRVPADVQGVVVTQLDPKSPVAQQGLKQGDVIEAIDRHTVRNIVDFERWLGQTKGQVLLLINHQGTRSFIAVPESAEPQ